MQNPNLEILISTINEGILKVPDVLLPPMSQVKYLVSWQQTGTVRLEVPESLSNRHDVKIVPLDGRGISANRNNALRNATGDILLLSDDDTRYEPSYLERIIYNFRKYPKADIICFRAIDGEGQFIKKYSEVPYIYAKRPRGTHFSSVEIAMRRRTDLPLFDERFGLGSKYLACGEEEIFLHDAFQQGLKIIYIPETVVQTDAHTTGKRFRTFAAVRRAKGAVLCTLYGPIGAAARSLKYAASLTEFSYAQRLHFYKDMLSGICYIETGKL